jgi:SAM-dependent methyltransferase
MQQMLNLYEELGLSNNEYTIYHARRFFEMFAYFDKMSDRCNLPLRILEIGTSAHTTPLYARLLPCTYDTICRPVTLGGPSKEWANEMGSAHHFEVDLNTENLSTIQISDNVYDVVICGEVIEHLMRAPRDIIQFAMRKLKTGGLLYMSTPNFLIPESVTKILSGRNPSLDFAGFENNYHAHHHFREYTANELIEEFAAADPTSYPEVIFSNCWDHPRLSSDQELMFRSNLVILATKR